MIRPPRRGAGISIVIFGIVVLTIAVVIRQHRQDVDVPFTPPAGAPPRAIRQPSQRADQPTTSIEPQDRGSTVPGRVSPLEPPRVAPIPASSTGIRDPRVADHERLATPPLIAPALPEEPPEAKKPIEAIEPDALSPAPVPAPEPREPAPPDRVFEQESLALAQVGGHYEQAYDRLDANGAAAIWPSVDSRALARAFARLQVQDLDFGDCTFAVSANDATARCAGVLHYARRIGDTTPKTEPHTWTIEFARAGEAWRIVRVTAR